MNALHFLYRMLFAVVLVVLFNAADNASSVTGTTSHVRVLEGHWQYRWGSASLDSAGHKLVLSDAGWREIDRPEAIDDNPYETDLWARITLPSQSVSAPALYILYVVEYLEVYLDDSLIYRYGDFSYQQKAPQHAWIWHLIDLPQNCAGRTLTLHVRSNFYKPSIQGEVLFGEGKELLDMLIRKDIAGFLLSLGTILTGIVFLIIAVIAREMKSYKGVIVAPIGIGMFGLFPLPIALWIYHAPKVYYFLEHAGLYIGVVGFLMLIESFIAVPYQKIFRRLWQAMSVYGIIMMVAEVTIYPSNLIHMLPLYFIILIFLFLLFWYSAKSMLLIERKMRIPLAALNIYAVLVIIEIILFYSRVILSESRTGILYVNIGSLFLFVVLGWMIFLHYDTTKRRIIVLQQEALNNQTIAHQAIEQQQRDHAEHEQNIILSRERERLRIAEDLHDELGSRLMEIRLVSELIRKEKNTASRLDELSFAADGLVTAFREIVWSLNPKDDSLENIVGYIAQHALDYLEKANIRCRLNLLPEFPKFIIDAQERHHLLMVIKEALNNIVKHSGASMVTMDVNIEQEHLHIHICDDGRGFDLSAKHLYGRGLKNIHRRIERIGGTVDITSEHGKGTSFMIAVPIEQIR